MTGPAGKPVSRVAIQRHFIFKRGPFTEGLDLGVEELAVTNETCSLIAMPSSTVSRDGNAITVALVDQKVANNEMSMVDARHEAYPREN